MSFSAARGHTFACNSAGRMSVKPSGFCKPAASLARFLFHAMPMEHVRPVFSRMAALIWRPASSAIVKSPVWLKLT